MPRRSGGGMRSSGSSRSSRSPPRRSTAAAAAPPRQTPVAPAARTQSGGMMSGLAGTMMQGMAFGAGSEVAHQAIRGVMGSGHSDSHSNAQPTQEQPQQTQQDPCLNQNQDFMSCLQRSANDISACQSYLDLYKQCRGQP